MKTAALVLVLAVLVAGCAGPRPASVVTPAAAPGMAVADADLGLVKEGVFDVPTPAAVTTNTSAPGELPVLPRAYDIAPPRVPHGIGDFLPITRTQNACVDCHAVADKKAGEPTPLPPSHYTDYRNAPDRVGATIVGARHVCISCHVPTTDAPDLVENRFQP
jgi:nitrate reductase (cytochrome), electron transfer subunit